MQIARYIRQGKLDLSTLSILKDKSKIKEYKIINGVSVKITSQRYPVFQKSKVCIKCKLEASFLAIEKIGEDTKHYHLNMYGINEKGEEVLFTKDHILAKSNGGKDIQRNYQTKCTICNSLKGNLIE